MVLIAAAIGTVVTCTAGSVTAAVVRPANDNFENAQPLIGTSGSVAGSNTSASAQNGEPSHAGSRATHSVWYSLTPGAGLVTIDTFGSGFNTVLAVYRGTDFGHFTEVAANDNAPLRYDTDLSRLSFASAAGTTYWIAVDGFFNGDIGATGPIALNWSVVADNFADAQTLSGVKGTVGGPNVDATAETGEPPHDGYGATHSVWYAYTPGRGSVTLDTFGSSFDTVLAVYTGTDVAHLDLVKQNDNAFDTSQSKLTFESRSNTTYWIAVDGMDGGSGNITLTWGFEGAKLAPVSAERTVGATHTVTATLTAENGSPLGAGKPVRFTVVAGPNTELESSGIVTNSDGQATWTYSSSRLGTDAIEARFDSLHDSTLISDRVTVAWVAAPQPPAPTTPATPGKVDVSTSLASPRSARVGQQLTFTATVKNGGPDTATGVMLHAPVPAAATLVSISASQGEGCTLSGTPTCRIGTLEPNGSATVRLVFTTSQAGSLSVSASAEPNNDTNPVNNSSSATVTVLAASAAPLPPPPPSQPGTFNAIGIGTVTVNGVVVAADQVFQLNSGDVVDVTGGTLTFTASDGSYLSVSATQFTARRTSSRGGSTAAGDVPAQFKVTQTASAGALTELTLLGGDFASCATSRYLSATDKRPVRALWGSGKGNFRTQARYSAATVRGTVWLTQDRCDGSLTSVVEGVVDVLDKSLNKTVAVSPGQSYLALPKPKSTFKPPTSAGGSQSAATVKQTGLVWAGRRFTSRAQFAEWLHARGKTWEQFRANYPALAGALASRR